MGYTTRRYLGKTKTKTTSSKMTSTNQGCQIPNREANEQQIKVKGATEHAP
jgi:hypothetical protein